MGKVVVAWTTGQSCLSHHLEIGRPIPGSRMSGGSSPDVGLEAQIPFRGLGVSQIKGTILISCL